jgi:sporulation protein YlmC with PRC-barrel domain
MLRKHMAACLTATALMAGSALAQTGTAPAQGSTPGQQAASPGASGKFMTQQSANQWRASQLVGLAVYGNNNERIGDINEVLLDRNGGAEAVVIGVGGFLGIGEKDVAVPFKAVEWKMGSDTDRTAANTGGSNRTAANTGDANRTAAGAGTSNTASGPANTTSGAPNTNSGPGTGTTGTTTSTAGPGGDGPRTAGNQAGSGPAGAGSSAANTTGSASGTAAGRTGDASGANRGYPDHAVVRMTKADLENAPTFRYASSTDTGSSGNAPARTGTGAGTTASGTANPPNAPR